MNAVNRLIASKIKVFVYTLYVRVLFLFIMYTVMAKNIGTLCEYDQRRLWRLIFIVNPFDTLF